MGRNQTRLCDNDAIEGVNTAPLNVDSELAAERPVQITGITSDTTNFSSKFLRHRSYTRAGHAAGHDVVEEREVGADIEGEAVHRDAAAHAHADGRDLRIADPDACGFAFAVGGDAIAILGGEGGYQRLLQGLHILADAATPTTQVDDGVADKLTGAVVCRLAAPVCEVRLDAELRKCLLGSEDVRLLSSTPERIDVGMLQQQQQVRAVRPATT